MLLPLRFGQGRYAGKRQKVSPMLPYRRLQMPHGHRDRTGQAHPRGARAVRNPNPKLQNLPPLPIHMPDAPGGRNKALLTRCRNRPVAGWCACARAAGAAIYGTGALSAKDKASRPRQRGVAGESPARDRHEARQWLVYRAGPPVSASRHLEQFRPATAQVRSMVRPIYWQ